MNCCSYDLGGSTLNCSVVNKCGEVLVFEVVTIENNIDTILEIIDTFYKKVKSDYKIEGITLSIPGIVDPSSGFVGGFSTLSASLNRNWKQLLNDRYNLPVSIENDANCALLGEVFTGKYKGAKNVALLSVGTAIGGSFMVGGKIVRGAKGLGGDFGTTIVNNESLSILAVEASMAKVASKSLNKAESVFDSAEAGDVESKEQVEHFYKNLAIGVYNISVSLDPELILISGGITEREGFQERLEKEVEETVKSIAKGLFNITDDLSSLYPTVCICTHRNKSNVIGAMYHWIQEYGV